MRVGILGGGNLGKAFSNLMTKNGASVLISDQPSTNRFLIEVSEILFLCTKPDIIPDLLNDINQVGQEKMIVSCAAGISLNYMEEKLEKQHEIIRCMSNIPIAFSKGSIVYTINEHVEQYFWDNFFHLTKGPFHKVVDNEKLLDVATILVGCMPGFLSDISSEFMEFGTRNGFTLEESRDLFISTMEGTAELMKHRNCEDIIKQVSSPNGVTASGIKYMRDKNLAKILSDMQDDCLETISKFERQ